MYLAAKFVVSHRGLIRKILRKFAYSPKFWDPPPTPRRIRHLAPNLTLRQQILDFRAACGAYVTLSRREWCSRLPGVLESQQETNIFFQGSLVILLGYPSLGTTSKSVWMRLGLKPPKPHIL